MMQAAHGIESADYAIDIRPAHADDLAALNGVIERALMTWQLPDRVKRLSLPSYRYHAHDLQHLQIVVAQHGRRDIVGVAAWEAASSRDLPGGKRGLLLHGLYVDPSRMCQGVGSRLLDAALAAARQQGFDGLLVKAKVEAGGFFAARGMTLLPVVDPQRDYPHRYWQSTRA